LQSAQDYQKNSLLTIDAVIEFVNLMKQNNLPLIDTWQLQQADQAVTLMTAHKSKGMEFETVFVVNCSKVGWLGSGGRSGVPVPFNLPIMAESDGMDDKLRLFYVAMTRARDNLYLTSYQLDDKGKEVEQLEFLQDVVETVELEPDPEIKTEPAKLWQSLNLRPIINPIKERNFLLPLLENYKLSATHLNNFLDISRGGPKYFKETNLLRFPTSPNPASQYGSAFHKTLADLYATYKDKEVLPDLDFLIQRFQSNLGKQKLSSKQFQDKLSDGNKYLTNYYQNNLDRVLIDQLIEFDFATQNVRIGEAILTGKIDKITKDSNNSLMTVTDFKTGKKYSKWTPSDSYSAIKLDKYRRQLIFYKLLVENSREFHNQWQVGIGELEFLESTEQGPIQILSLVINDEETQQLSKLIEIVYARIMNCDFPSVEQYSHDVAGTNTFIGDLLRDG